MKQIVLGNAGAGKTTLARRLACEDDAAVLCLDAVAFDASTRRRAIHESVADAMDFAARHERWVIEGCYADLIEPLLAQADRLIFLNPGVERCVAHCRQRPWEPDKFDSPHDQQRHLQPLIDWVRRYNDRQDEYGLARHQLLYDQFDGVKLTITDLADCADM